MSNIQLIDNFWLNDEGYALTLKLIEERIKNDINDTRLSFENEQYNQSKLEQQSGLFNSFKQMRSSSKLGTLKNNVNAKEEWLRRWQNDNWKAISGYERFANVTISQLVDKFMAAQDGRIRIFLMLQEAVFSPVYGEFEGYPKNLKENDQLKGIEHITRLCGFDGSLGIKLIKDAEAFFKEIKNENGRTAKFATAGFLAVAGVASIVAFPIIAPAIGAVMGLSGAAATAAGLAFLGGGSIAAGGLGMAGGMAVLVGGSAILGAVGGGTLAKLLSKMPHETLALSLAKILNLLNYLKNPTGDDRIIAQQLFTNTINAFLEFKHSAEREILMGKVEGDKKDQVQTVQILYQAFKRVNTLV